MKTARFLMVIVAILVVADCRDAAGPTAVLNPSPARTAVPTPPPAPMIAGTWDGTATCDDGSSGPITVKLEQPGGGRSVNGSIPLFRCGNCGSGLIYAQLVDALPWKITGTVSYKSNLCYPYVVYSGPLSGSLIGSPVSRISATAGPFKSKYFNLESPGVRLELTTKSAP